MRIVREAMRAVPVIVVAMAVGMALTGGGAPPETRVGTAALAISDDTARVVERVGYRGDVERVGDVVLGATGPLGPIEQPDVAAAWKLVDRVWPESRRDELVQLSVVREGPLGLVGVIHPASGSGWILSLDAADLDRTDVIIETIVHELAHAVTLGPEQFVFGSGAGCDGLRIDLGCASGGSMLARFGARFWPDGEPGDDTAGAFVTEYARTAVYEDLAETFTAWVFDWPIPHSSEAGAKIAHLETEPELVTLRDELLSLVAAG